MSLDSKRVVYLQLLEVIHMGYRMNHNGAVAQLGERLNGIQKVVGSTPISSTTIVNAKFIVLV